jgi:hypothetical protein
MTAIPLPTGVRGKQYSPKQRERLVNCFAKSGELSTILTRLGVESIANGIGKCRGRGLFKEELYQVSNDRLLKITVDQVSKSAITPVDVTTTDLGKIAGLPNCKMAAGYTELCIMVIGGPAYVYNDTDGLREITDANYLPSVDVAYDGGRFVFIPADGGPFFWSKLENPAAIDSQAYADAEEFPDPNKAVQYYQQSIDVLGTRSIERLQYDVTQSSYLIINAVSSKVGYIGGKTDYGETYAFIGQEDGGASLYVMGQGPQAVRNEVIDELFNQQYTQAELAECESCSFMWNGQNIALFRLPRHTLALYPTANGLDVAFWHSNKTIGDEGQLRWGFVQAAYGFLWTGDFLSSDIGIIRDNGRDYASDIYSRIVTYARLEERDQILIRDILLSCTVGQHDGGQISMQLSEDGLTYFNEMWEELGEIGEYNREVSFGPAGQWFGFVGFMITWIGKISVNTDGLYIK